MDVAQATAPGATATPNGAQEEPASALNSDFETFLKMLTTQMQNQDPLNPIESQNFATQLATFSGVEQQVRTNDLLQGLGLQMGVMGMSQMAGWVGMEARAAAPAFFDGSPVVVSPNPAIQADGAVLVVRNEGGDEVQRLDIPVSAEPLDWAGVDDGGSPFPTGLYSFEVESYSNGALMTTTPAEIYSTITEARGENGETVLILEGGARVTSEEVTALRQPGA